ncbi:MAG: lchAA, partial [Bacilli bacterium]|nr:lchAA [Bacilli bacterium]
MGTQSHGLRRRMTRWLTGYRVMGEVYPSIRDRFFYLAGVFGDTRRSVFGPPAGSDKGGISMRDTYYPLTHAQKRIWYTEKFYPGTSISNLSGFGKLKSETEIDCNLVIDAIRQVVRLNEPMRLRLAIGDGEEPTQYVSAYQEFDIEWFDCGKFGDVQEILAWGQVEASKPMTLYDSDLFHVALFQISDKESWVFVKVHHVIADGISIVLLGNQIVDMYLELAKGNHEGGMDPISYAEHIQSELDYERSERFQKDKAYWNAKFESIPESTSLKRNESQRIRTEAVRLSKDISKSTQQNIESFCRENNVGVLSLFLSLVDIYISRATGQGDVVVGTFMGNRTSKKEKLMLGMFVSTVPIRTHVDDNLDFLTFVHQKMKDQMTIIRHQKYPYTVLVNDLRKRQSNTNRLFGISLEFQVMQWFQKENISYLTEPLFSGNEINDISIHVKARWDTGTLQMDMDYRTELFSSDEMENFYQSIIALLEDALAHPTKKISELEICSEEEKHRLLMHCHQPRISFPPNMTLHHLFEQQAAKFPEQAAVVYEGTRITYKELNERSNRLARILREKGIGRNSPVAIWMNRSEGIATAIMGVLKAGGAYVPIDPDLPEERIRFMIEDSGAKVLITEQRLVRRYNLQVATTLVLDEGHLNEGESGNLSQDVGPQDLAYIIYTSGTTGYPKGVMIEHFQVQHLIEGLRNQVYAAYETPLNVAIVAPFHFDASVQQIFASLLLGHTLFIVPKSYVSDGRVLAEYYRSNRIDVTDGTPAHLQMLLAAGNLQGVALRHMLIGGEALPHATVRGLLELFLESGLAPTITNVYGPTECCVDASAFDISPIPSAAHSGSTYVPIGRPLGNHRLYILDAYGRMQPAGVQGELYIAGDGVGRGYLNLPEVTQEKFTADPYVPGERMYKTGDLARMLPDGNVEFLGRKDDQVKIRGYRIELGEIEAVLQKHVRVEKAVVLARLNEQTGSELCAYVLCKNTGNPITVAEFREYLSTKLPSYMLPSYFVQLEQMPLTSSGKVDRKALLRHEVAAVSGRDYAPPANELEAQVAQIWEDVLGMERVGVYDNFFELGGHSLKAIAFLSLLHKTCGVEVPLQALFETPTVSAIARYIAEADRSLFESIEPAEASDVYPLSFAQQRVYIVSQFEDAGIGYNMPAAVMIEGLIDIPRLEQSFRQLIHRHEALRTSFVTVDGVPMQKVDDQVAFQIVLTERGQESLESTIASFVRPFNLSQAPLIRLGLVPLAEDKHVLLFDMHHLISDGVSIGIILDDLVRLYEGERLPGLRLQYKDYAAWQSRQMSSGYPIEEKYWLERLSGELPVLQLLTDYPRPPVQNFEGDRVSIVLHKVLTEKLNRLAEKNGTTLYMVMLAAYYVLLANYTGEEDILVGTPVAGRNHADLEGIVGMFVNTLAIRTN